MSQRSALFEKRNWQAPTMPFQIIGTMYQGIFPRLSVNCILNVWRAGVPNCPELLFMKPRLKCWRCSEDSRAPAISFFLINSCLTFLTLFYHQWKAGGETGLLFPSAGLNFATIISNSVGSRAREKLKADNRHIKKLCTDFFLKPWTLHKNLNSGSSFVWV